jgi:hypothetical protein
MSLPLLRQQWPTRLSHNVRERSPALVRTRHAARLPLHASRLRATACHGPPNCQRALGPDLDERPHDLSITQDLAIGADSPVHSSCLDATGDGPPFRSAEPSRFVRGCAPTGDRLLFMNQRYIMKPGRCTLRNSFLIRTLSPVSTPFVGAYVCHPAHRESGCTVLWGNELPEHRVSC